VASPGIDPIQKPSRAFSPLRQTFSKECSFSTSVTFALPAPRAFLFCSHPLPPEGLSFYAPAVCPDVPLLSPPPQIPLPPRGFCSSGLLTRPHDKESSSPACRTSRYSSVIINNFPAFGHPLILCSPFPWFVRDRRFFLPRIRLLLRLRSPSWLKLLTQSLSVCVSDIAFASFYNLVRPTVA